MYVIDLYENKEHIKSLEFATNEHIIACNVAAALRDKPGPYDVIFYSCPSSEKQGGCE